MGKGDSIILTAPHLGCLGYTYRIGQTGRIMSVLGYKALVELDGYEEERASAEKI